MNKCINADSNHVNNSTHRGRAKMAAIFQMIFQKHFLERKCMNLGYDFTVFFPKAPFNHTSSIGSDNGLASVTRQAILWTNDG